MTGALSGYIEPSQIACNGTVAGVWDFDLLATGTDTGICMWMRRNQDGKAIPMYSVLLHVTQMGDFPFSILFYSNSDCTAVYPDYNNVGGGCMNLLGLPIGSFKIEPTPA